MTAKSPTHPNRATKTSDATLEGPVTLVAPLCLTMFADLQSIVNSERIKFAHFETNRRGRHIGRPPYGYRRAEIAGQKGHLAIFPPEAAIVRKIFEWCSTDMSLSAVARQLNEIGVRPAQGKKWNGKGVDQILQNTVYKGYVRYNMTTKFTDLDSGQTFCMIRPVNECRVSRGRHAAIVEAATFDAIQGLRAVREMRTVRPRSRDSKRVPRAQ